MSTDSFAGGIQISNLSKTYINHGKQTEALRDITIDIQSGEFIVLLGRSGCGKSTLLRMLGGLLSPTSGYISYKKKSLYDSVQKPDHEVLGSLGYVFQEANLLPWRTVARNIELPLEVQGITAEKRNARVAELAESVGLQAFLDHLPKALSGGMQQRTSIARALADNPDVLLMDEPFGALDAFTREDMNLMLQDIWLKEKKTVVLVTHSITEAVFLADRIFVLSPHPGQIQCLFENVSPRPRSMADIQTPNYQSLIAQLRKEIGEH